MTTATRKTEKIICQAGVDPIAAFQAKRPESINVRAIEIASVVKGGVSCVLYTIIFEVSE